MWKKKFNTRIVMKSHNPFDHRYDYECLKD